MELRHKRPSQRDNVLEDNQLNKSTSAFHTAVYWNCTGTQCPVVFYISLLLTKNFKLEDEGSSIPLYTRLSLLGLLKGNGVRFRVLEEVVFMALESSVFILNYLIDETLTCDTVTVSKRELTEKTYDKKQNKIYKRRFEKNLKQHSVEIVTAVTMTAVHENLL